MSIRVCYLLYASGYINMAYSQCDALWNETCSPWGFSLQLCGFMEKYGGTGVIPHVQTSSNKENRCTDGLNRYLQTLQSSQSATPGQFPVRTMCITQEGTHQKVFMYPTYLETHIITGDLLGIMMTIKLLIQIIGQEASLQCLIYRLSQTELIIVRWPEIPLAYFA